MVAPADQKYVHTYSSTGLGWIFKNDLFLLAVQGMSVAGCQIFGLRTHTTAIAEPNYFWMLEAENITG